MNAVNDRKLDERISRRTQFFSSSGSCPSPNFASPSRGIPERMTAFATTGSLGSAQLEPNRNSGLQSLVETRPMPSASIGEGGRRRRWVLCLALVLVVSLTGIGRAQDLVSAEAFDDLAEREEGEIASADRSVPSIPPPFLPPEIAQLPLSVITAAPPRQPANVPALGDDPVAQGDLGSPSDPVLGPGSVQHPVGRPLAENSVVQISETLLPDGSFSVETNIQANLDLAAIVTAKAGPLIVAPTVVERGPGYRIIESISREASKNGSDLLKTNRYTIRGELKGEEALPGVRTSSIQPPTVVEAGEHYKRVESITEFLDFDGSRILKTNSFVEFDSDAARAAALTNLDVLHWSSHQKVVRRQIPEYLANGRLRLRSSTYTELGAGIAYQDEKGQWRDSVPQFEILPDGSGLSARQIPHKVLLKSNPNAEDPVQVTLPDGTLLKSRVLGLGYFDRTSGKSVTIASLKDSVGQLNEARNEVVFPDAFQGVSASIRLVLSSGGIEQDIILDERPGRPEDYDKSFNSETSELEVITEFFPEKEPRVTRQVIQKAAPEAALAMAEPELTDESIDFSGMEIGRGRAFSLENAPGESSAAEVGVRKRWQTIEGRTILFEAVSYPELKTLTSKLPEAAPVEQKPRAATGRTLPARQLARTGSGNAKVQVARAGLPRRGVVLDYALVGTATNVTLSSGTYLVKAPITLTGNTVIQGGVVVKEASAASITLKDTVTCQTSSSAKAYFVSVNDNTVGETIVPGAPVGVYAYQAINLSSVNGGTTLSYLEIRNATYGVAVDNSSVAINNCRFVDCNYAIQGHYSTVTSLNLSYCGGADWTYSGPPNSSTYVPTNPIADCASPCAGDDHGNRPSQATLISLGASTAGTINCSGDEDFFVVNVSSPGNLVVYTTGSTDTYGHLLDSKGYELMSDDDSAVAPNFRISYPVSPGAYYIRVRHKSGGTGSYQLQAYTNGPTLISGISSFAGLRNNYSGWVGLQFAVGSAPVWVSDLGRWIVSGNSQTHSVKLFDSGGVALNGGSVQIDTSGKPPGQFAYASLPQPIMLAANTIYVLMSLETDGGDQWYNNTGTSVTLDPVAGNAYGAFSSSLPFYQTYTAGASYVPVDLKFAAANVSDDYGNSIGTAATAALNSNISGQLNYGGDNDFFRIVVGSSGYLTIYTTGATDTYGYLLDSSGNELNHNDDNPYPNFAITRLVSAGTYYAQVRSFSGGTGSYVFRADFSASQPPAVSAPSFNAPSFNSDHTVATVSATSQVGATVCYSIDGSDPTSGYSTVPPSVSSTYAVIKARAFQAGYSASAVTTMTPIPKAGPVSFSPANHSAIQYANGPLAVTMTAVPGATISYVETGSYWKTTTSGSSPSFDGMGAGSGIIQAWAFTSTTFRGDPTYSGTYYFRVPQPTSAAAYPVAPATSATLTLNTLPGATLDLYLAGSGSPVSLIADNTGVATRPVPSATRIRVKARKAGYIDSGFVTAHVNQLNAPKIVINGVALSPGNTVLNNSPADVWLLPNFGFDNAYGETLNLSAWNSWNVSPDPNAPSSGFPGSFKGMVANSSGLYSTASVDVSYGRTYTVAGYYRKELAGGPSDYAGVYNFADDGTPVSADDINDQHYPATYLTASLADGGTTVLVADAQTFANRPPEFYYNIFTPLVNFSQTASVLHDNQPNGLSDLFQYQDISTASMEVAGVTGNTLTLQNAYHGPTLQPGTPVCRRDAGGWWQYQLLSTPNVPLTWSYFSNEFSYLRPGTTAVRIGSLLYSGTTKVTGMEFWEGTLAQRPKVYYRTDGNPDLSGQQGQTMPVKITINSATSITAGQRGSQYFDSPVGTYNLIFQAAKPQLTTTLNSSGSVLTIVASTLTAGASIYYSTDETEPTTSSTLYTGGSSGITVAASVTTKWKAFKSNYSNSDTVTQLGVPTFSPPGGAYNGGQTVTISAPSGAQVKVLQPNANILDASTWVVGSQGSQPGFSQKGDTIENAIELRTTPYGTTDKVWVGYNMDTAPTGSLSDGDGGWESSTFNVDRTKTYRFSVWLRRLDATPDTVSGISYLGPLGGTVSDLTGTTSDSANSNPYFLVTQLPANQWFLFVGYVRPAGDTTPVVSSASRIFNVQGQAVANGTDFRWLSGTTSSYHRTYLFYCNELGVQQEFWNPRVEVVASVSDPTPADLLLAPPESSPKNLTVPPSGMQPVQAQSWSSGANILASPVLTQTYTSASSSVAAQPASFRSVSPPSGGVKQARINATTATTPPDIRYTSSGNDPVATDPQLPSGGQVLPAAGTVRLKAFKNGYTPSPTEVSVNQPPALTFGQGPNNAYSDQLAGVEYLLFVQVTGGTGSLTDSDSYNFGYGELRVLMNSPMAGDQLRCHPSRNGLTFVPAASGDPNVTPGEIRDAAGKVGSFVGGYDGTALVITFDVNASPGLAQDVLLGIGYRYSGAVIASTARPFTVTAKDGDGGTTTKSGTLNVVPSGSLTLTAGPDQTVTIGRVVELAGYLNNRAVLTGPGLTVAWEKVSGPGDVSFANAGSSFTHSGFGLPGEYELKLSVDKDGTVVADTTKITVLPANPALVVNAGPDRTLSAGTLPTTFQAESSVVGNSLPPVYSATWSKIDGPPGSSVTFTSRGISGQPDKVTASFSDVGTYTLRLDVVDGTRSGGDEVTIRLCSGVQRPLDLMLAIDTSGSMLNGARLESAKAGVLDLLGRLAGEGIAVKVGAVAFTDNPCQFLPLTTDINVAKQFVKSLEVTPFSLTSLKDGLLRAKQELLGPRRTGSAGQPSTYSMPLIVVVSDGLLSLRDTSFPGCLFYPFGNASDVLSVANNIKPLITIATISATEKVADTEVLNWTMCNDTYYQQTYADAMNLLRDVASPGLFREIQSASDIKDAVGSILDGICRGQSASEVPGPGTAVMTAVANCDRFVVQEDSRQNVLNVLLNDDQRSGHSYQVALAQDASPHGKVSLGAANGTFNYDPSPNYSWTMGDSTPDTFTYTLLEDGQQVGTATVTVWVSPVNDPPQANDDKYVVASSSSGPVTLPVLDNDTDPDINPANATQYDELQIVALSPLDPAAGSIAIVPDGKHLSFTRVAGSGTYAFSYTIRDSRGSESTARVTLQIGGSGLQPILKPDVRMVLRGLQNVRIDVLANDQNPALDGSTLTITTVVRDPLDNVANPSRGTLAVESGGHAVLFSSDGQVGTMTARYDVTGAGGAVASAMLTITVVDELNLNQPPVALDDLNYTTIENSTPGFPMIIVPVLGNDSDPEGDVLTIATWTQGSHGATVTKLSNPERLQYNPGTYRGTDSFTYVVADQKGNRSTARVTVHVKASGNAAPQADISNMGRDTATYPETPVTPANSTDRPEYRDQILVVKDATLQVKGTALDANAPPVGNDFFQYTLTLSRLARDSEAPAWKSPFEVQRIVSNTQVQAGAVLGTFDLSTLPNGSYFVELNVQGGADFATPVQRRFILDNQLKLGDFTFTVEDLNVPVEGVPLSVQRTYSSLDANAGKGGDFGPGWKYSLIDLDVELDEMREEVEELVQFSPSRETFSKRVNPDGPSAMSGRNVTLTLPDGRRTTFYFSPKIDNTEQKVIPMWKTLPGVGARLELLDWQNGTYTGNEYIGIPTLKWAANGHVALDGYDIRGFKLILADGTEYTMLREDLGWHEYSNVSNPTVSDIGVQAWGKPYVSEIKLKSGERLVFDGQGVSAFVGSTLRKSLRIERENGRITAIYDPLDPQGTPALIYTYDEKGDLREVRQRVKRTSVGNAEYLTTKYFYDDPQRPHFLTAIVDARGKRVAQNTYDAKGRLSSRMDGVGNVTTFDYDQPVTDQLSITGNRIKGKVVTTVDGQSSATLVTGYDGQGNVVYTKDLYGSEKTYIYDTRGIMLNETAYLTSDPNGAKVVTTQTPSAPLTLNEVEYIPSIETFGPYDPANPPANMADVRTLREFEPSGVPKRTVRPDGAVEINTYDGVGRPLKVYNKELSPGVPDESSALIRWDYSNGEKEETVVSKNGSTPVYQAMTLNSGSLYNTPNGSTTLSDGLGTTLTGTYDANLRMTSLSANGQNSTFTYDDMGRDASATYPGSIGVNYAYDGNGDWTQVSGTATLGSMTRAIDASGRLSGWTLQDGSQPAFAYDNLGRLSAESDSAGAVTTHTHNGLEETIKRPGTVALTSTREKRGLVAREQSSERDVAYQYDAAGRVVNSLQINALHPSHMVSHAPSGNGLDPGPAGWSFQYSIEHTGGASGPANGSSVTATDPLGRVSTSLYSKEGLLLSVTGNSCCGNTQFTYLLDDPMLEAEEYPRTITDAGNRVRTLSYYAGEAGGSAGQLKSATDLAGKNYTFEYFTPNASPYQSGLRYVKAPIVPLRNVGNTTETLLEYTYDSQEREETIRYAGLSAVKRFNYNTTTDGAKHLPSSIDLPNSGAIDFRYEANTGRLTERYLKRRTSGTLQLDSNADEKATFSYEPGDKIDKVEYLSPAGSGTKQVMDYGYGRICTVDAATHRVLVPDHTLVEGDAIRFSSTATLPGGITSGTPYYVFDSIEGQSFQIKAAGASVPVNITSGSGIITVSDGDDWAVLARSEINVSNGASTGRSELIHRKRHWLEHYQGSGWVEELGVRAKSNGTSTKTYVSEYEYNGLGHLQAIDVYVETGLNSPSRSRQYRFEFERDKLGRLELRTAFKANGSDDDSLLTPVLRTDYEYYKNGANPANGDFVQSIEHKGYPSGAVLEKATYVRGPVGEPTSVQWLDNTSVTIGYQSGQGLRVVSEDFSGTTADNSYTYIDNGSRASKTMSGTTYSYGYDPGFQLKEIKQGTTVTQTYGYDSGGNVNTIVTPTISATYTVDDRLSTISKSGNTTSYYYDPEGRRVRATSTGLDRRFVVGPSIGSSLEVIHMITDASDNVKAVYIYAGDQPLMRFEVDGSGNPSNAKFYMEDASGSVLGLANATGGLDARFRYDGFGNTRSGFTDPTTFTATGSGGDFRFHGAWLESNTGFYHMRARDYDPETGRFLERDPWKGIIKTPETLHAYAFANSNPYLYSDPSGEFTIIEINIANSMQVGFQGLRTTAIAQGRKKVFETIGNIAKDQVVKQVKGLLPTQDFLASFKEGVALGDVFRRTICNSLHAPDNLYFEVPITTDGRPLADGFSCNEKADPKEILRMAGLSVPRPDIVIGPRSPHAAGSFPKAWLIAEAKATTAALFTDYLRPGSKTDQFWSIINYAGKHTYSRTALFITGIRGQVKGQRPSDMLIIEELGRSSLQKGVIPVVVRIVD